MTGNDRRRPAGGTLAVLVVVGLLLRASAAGAAVPPAASDIYLLYFVDVGSRATPYIGGGLGVSNADGSDFFMHVGGGVDVATLG